MTLLSLKERLKRVQRAPGSYTGTQIGMHTMPIIANGYKRALYFIADDQSIEMVALNCNARIVPSYKREHFFQIRSGCQFFS